MKSAYFVDLMKKRQKSGESSCVDRDDEQWKRIWQMDVPGKVKQYLIRKALNNILPTRANLHQKRIVENRMCQFATLRRRLLFMPSGIALPFQMFGLKR